MIQLAAGPRAKLFNIGNKPLELLELYLDSGTFYFSTETVTWNGNTYLGYVMTRDAVKKYDGAQFDNFSITLSNVDTYMAQLVQAQELQGREIILRRVDREDRKSVV